MDGDGWDGYGDGAPGMMGKDVHSYVKLAVEVLWQRGALKGPQIGKYSNTERRSRLART